MTSNDWTPEDFALDSVQIAQLSAVRKRKPMERISGRFFPAIPETWAQIAFGCGDRGLGVALVLWRAWRTTRENPVNLTPSRLDVFGIDPKTAKRVLLAMQESGLVTCDFHRGRSPRVTLLTDCLHSDP